MNGRLAIVLAGIATLASFSVSAADENFDVYVFADAKYDDNVFRVANAAEAFAQNGSTTRDDISTTFGVGAKAKIPVSRQQFNFDAELRRTIFNRFSQLNNNNGEFKGEWEWAYASRVSGTLGYEYERDLTDFFELQSAIRDTTINQNFFGSVKFPIRPRWTLVIGGDVGAVSFDARPFLDRDQTSVFGEVLFQTRAKTFVGLRLRESDAEFDSNLAVNNDFSETEVSAVFRYEASDKSRLSVSLGRTDRDAEDPLSGDFSGATGRVEYRRVVSGKTAVTVALFRQASLVDEIASLVVTDGISIRPVWEISSRLRFNGNISYEERDFGGAGFVVSERADDLLGLSAGFSYKLNRAFTFNVGLRNRSRGSSNDGSEFDQTEFTAGVRFNI